MDTHWMHKALAMAQKAERQDEVPIGAVIVIDDTPVAYGYNQCISHNDPTAHAEIVALRDACKRLNNYRLINATLYCTIEPCAMCATAMVHARIKRLVYGAKEPKAGAVESQLQLLQGSHVNHQIEILGGVCALECAELISSFFRKKRLAKKLNLAKNVLA